MTTDRWADGSLVVLVDDDVAQHELCALALRRLGHPWQLESFTDARQAAGRFREWAGRGSPTPVLVLLDLRMPDFDGLDLLDYRQDHLAAWPVPFVVLSSSDDLRDIARCRAAGCDDYLLKPERLRDLVVILEDQLDQASAPRRSGRG